MKYERSGTVTIVDSKRKLISITVDQGIVFFKDITQLKLTGGRLIGGENSGMAFTLDQYTNYTSDYIFRFRLKVNDLQKLAARGSFIKEPIDD